MPHHLQNQPGGLPGAQAQVAVGTARPEKTAMARTTETDATTPEARRREIAGILAAAMLRLRTRPRPVPTLSEEEQKSSLSALANVSSPATYVTVREDVNAKTEDRT